MSNENYKKPISDFKGPYIKSTPEIKMFDITEKDVASIIEFNQEKLIDSIIERFPDDTFLKADGFDEAIIGVEENTGKLIYSMSKCLDILRQDMTEEDALEHFYYNVHGSYVGDQTPIWCFDYFE